MNNLPANTDQLLDLLADALFESFIYEIDGVKPRPHVDIPVQEMADRALQTTAQ